jgi:hypothetical protein
MESGVNEYNFSNFQLKKKDDLKKQIQNNLYIKHDNSV